MDIRGKIGTQWVLAGIAAILLGVILIPLLVLGLPWSLPREDFISREMREKLSSWVEPLPALIVFDERMDSRRYHFVIDALIRRTDAPIVVFTSPGTADLLRRSVGAGRLVVIEVSYRDREELLSGKHLRILRTPCDRFAYRSVPFTPEFSFETNFLSVLSGASPLEQAETDQAVRGKKAYFR